MPIDRISSPSSLLETMRALARDRSSTASQGDKAATTTSGANPVSTPNGAPPIAELRRRLRELVAHVDVTDKQSLANAREPTLREILLWEFGSNFRQDPQFLSTVDAINRAFDADPRFPQRFADLVSGLQK